MLRLLLLRHAKSSWDNPALDDFDRPLAKRGTKAAARMGEYLRKADVSPDIVLCSTAVRTRATLTLLLAELKGPPPRVLFSDTLYLADADTLLSAIHNDSDGAKTLMLIGHNPGLHALALQLTGNGSRETLAELAMQFPTAALAQITFDAERWPQIHAGSGTLVDFVLPRRLS